MSTTGRLYLIPVPISDAPLSDFIPAHNAGIVKGLRHFIAEDAKTARRWLKAYGYPVIADAEILLLNEHTRAEETPDLLVPLMAGHNTGLMSDAGCPGIADPGAAVVKLAHQRGIDVLPLAGPSSIVMGLMASGFSGQNFAFSGYLPVDKTQRQKRIRELEQLARQGQAQFFIETPYRNEQLMESLLLTLAPATLLFVGRDVTGPAQLLRTRSVADWKKAALPGLHKVPAVFGIFT